MNMLRRLKGKHLLLVSATLVLAGGGALYYGQTTDWGKCMKGGIEADVGFDQRYVESYRLGTHPGTGAPCCEECFNGGATCFCVSE